MPNNFEDLNDMGSLLVRVLRGSRLRRPDLTSSAWLMPSCFTSRKCGLFMPAAWAYAWRSRIWREIHAPPSPLPTGSLHVPSHIDGATIRYDRTAGLLLR